MKKMMIFIAALIILSCTKNEQQEGLVGNWESVDFELVDDVYVTTYVRVKELREKVSVVFEDNGVFRSWDFGWCGTPPHVYFFTDGEFEISGDVIDLDIDHYYFGETDLKIYDLSQDTLRLGMLR